MQKPEYLRRRLIAATAAVLTLASFAVIAGSSSPASATPTPPPNPTDQQLQNAANAKEQVAQQIGVLNGNIAAAQIKLQQVQNSLELAEQKVALAVSNEQLAAAAAAKAKANATAVNRKAVAAHTAYVSFIQTQYYGQSIDGAAGSLLSAKNPSEVLQQSTLAQYQATNKLHAVDDMQTALVTKQNADVLAVQAQDKAVKASAVAKSAMSAAAAQYKSAQTMEASLQASLAASQQELAQKQSEQATLLGERQQYKAYVAEQRRIAEAKARALRIAQEQARQARLAAEAAAAARAARQQNNSGYSGSSGGSTPVYSSGPSAPSGGSWSAAKGRRAVDRARSTEGIIYAWAGGNQYGPTRGVCAGDGAYNDCNVIGYDCSGLAMYAWGQGWVHYAATQYTQAGSYHPSIDSLMPGDLLFYSSDGTIGGIHHVAIYAGGGDIIQAPESGEVIQESSMYAPGPIFGATRPLT